MKRRGSCLCGAVAFEIEEPFEHFLYCHCSRCRKATGTAHAANIVVDPSHFLFTKGEDRVSRFDLPTAKSFATAFCRTCGAPMPHRTRSGKRVIVPAGSLDEPLGAQPTAHAYWASRAGWFEIDSELPRIDEALF